MKAIVITSPGGPEVLTLHDVPEPIPPAGHVRVRVRYAGVNRADIMQRRGHYPAPPGAPRDTPGLEYSGVVDALGDGVDGLAVGDRVFGIAGGGAYAECILAHARETVRVPDAIDDRSAAAIPEAFITAYDALITQAWLAAGEWALIHAAGSGVGTAGIQIAKAVGANVVGTSRTEAKLARCRELGLDHGVVTMKDVPFADQVRDLTRGRGVDVVLDLIGGPRFGETLACCAPRGRTVLVGLTAGAAAQVDLGAILRARLRIVGTVMRARPLEEKIAAATVLEKNLLPLFEQGKLRPIIDRSFPLGDAAGAHAYLESDESFGKVLLEVAG